MSENHYETSIMTPIWIVRWRLNEIRQGAESFENPLSKVATATSELIHWRKELFCEISFTFSETAQEKLVKQMQAPYVLNRKTASNDINLEWSRTW